MKAIQIIIAILLLLCLAPMPYGYYELIRYLTTVFFVWMAYKYYEEEKCGLMITFVALAILFQPFIKIALGRLMWNIVDVIVAIGLIVLGYIRRK